MERVLYSDLSEVEKIVQDVTALSRAFGFCIPASVERLKQQAPEGEKLENAVKPTYSELSAALAAAIERRASVEQALYEMGSGKRPLPDAAECKRLARKLGMPKEG